MGTALKQKIALFTNVAPDAVFSAEDVDCIYEVPAKFHKQGVDEKIAELLNIWSRAPELTGWEQVVERMRSPQSEVEIALVGKYVELGESYKSLNEAIMHGGIANDCRVHLRHVDSEEIERKGASCLESADGILVAPGFGTRGSEGKIEAARYAREKGVPYFGICLGLQIATIEFARNVAGLRGANSTEFEPKPAHPVIDFMPDQRNVTDKGATMRLGAYPCVLAPGTRARSRLRRARDLRTTPPSLRGQQRLPRASDGGWPRDFRRVARRPAGRDDRAAQPPLLRRTASSTPSSSRDRRTRTRSSDPSLALRCVCGWRSDASFQPSPKPIRWPSSPWQKSPRRRSGGSSPLRRRRSLEYL